MLAELRSPEQVDADVEIDLASRDEPVELVRKLQDAVAACGTFIDYWYEHNNLPAPPSPFVIAMELMGRDLVAEEIGKVISEQVVVARRQRKVELRVLATELQLPLL